MTLRIRFIASILFAALIAVTAASEKKVITMADYGLWRTVNVAGPTWTDTMRTMVQGSATAPGLMGIWPPHQRPELRAAQRFRQLEPRQPHLREDLPGGGRNRALPRKPR